MLFSYHHLDLLDLPIYALGSLLIMVIIFLDLSITPSMIYLPVHQLKLLQILLLDLIFCRKILHIVILYLFQIFNFEFGFHLSALRSTLIFCIFSALPHLLVMDPIFLEESCSSLYLTIAILALIGLLRQDMGQLFCPKC